MARSEDSSDGTDGANDGKFSAWERGSNPRGGDAVGTPHTLRACHARTTLLRHDSLLKIENTTCITAIMIGCALHTNDIAATSNATLDASRPASRLRLPTTIKRSQRGCEADKSAALRPVGGFIATG